MTAIYDADTGHVSITASKNGAAVNLTGATVTVIAKAKPSGPVSTLAEVAGESVRANGVVVADAAPLTVGTYELVLRAVASGVTATYPSADKQPEVLFVVPDLDAV
jgi:hypothetical protein